MVSPHSVGSNCKEDDCEILDNLKLYLGTAPPNHTRNNIHPDDINIVEDTVTIPTEGVARLFREIAVGDFFSKLGPIQCTDCLSKQCTIKPISGGELNSHRGNIGCERGFQSPSGSFTKIFLSCRDLVLRILPMEAHRRGIGDYLKTVISAKVDFSDITCLEHRDSFSHKFIDSLINYIIRNWCESENRCLNGKNVRVRMLYIG